MTDQSEAEAAVERPTKMIKGEQTEAKAAVARLEALCEREDAASARGIAFVVDYHTTADLRLLLAERMALREALEHLSGVLLVKQLPEVVGQYGSLELWAVLAPAPTQFGPDTPILHHLAGPGSSYTEAAIGLVANALAHAETVLTGKPVEPLQGQAAVVAARSALQGNGGG